MMIYRKGEVVEVTGTLDSSMESYVGKVGKIEKVGDLENDNTPFIVSFFSGGTREMSMFSHTELRLLDGAEDQPKRQRHNFEARLYRMQKKV